MHMLTVPSIDCTNN